MVLYRILPLLVLAAVVGIGAQGGNARPVAPPKPDATRFDMEVLVPGGELDEPMAFAVAGDGRVFIAERRGALKLYQPSTGTTKTVRVFQVFQENEQGLIGVTLDPGFDTNRWVYVHYAEATESVFLLRRLTLNENDEVVAGSERTLLRIPVDRANTNHTGGGMTWDGGGNLFLTVGNNTGNQTFMQTDERPGRENFDDQRGAANTNDFRGKILRIRPQADGTYSIPAGNLFPPGTPNTRPEIYSMGHRNAWRISLDSSTGYVYWGEIGPDQTYDGPSTPRGYDEFNRATGPGFFGWPYFIGKNHLARFADYVNNEFGPVKDPQRPINSSRNNTGLRELPPAVMPLVEYPFAESEEYPQLGSGSRCAVGGPIYRRADFAASAERPWSAYYEGKWIVTDCVRSWVKAITVSSAGAVESIEEVFPNPGLAEPMDLKFGPQGDLYILDYGSIWNTKSPDSKLVRIKHQAGNRVPVAVATASVPGGVAPLTVRLDATKSKDFDGDTLTYAWRVTAPGVPDRTYSGAAADVVLTERATYRAELTVRDTAGATGSDAVEVVAGNSTPIVRVNVTGNVPGNDGFFVPGAPVTYQVEVQDREDGGVGQGIDPNAIAVSIDYLPDGFDVEAMRATREAVGPTTRLAVGRTLLEGSDCRACHHPTIRTRGPAMQELAARYTADDATLSRLASKVRDGGTGEWGTEVMPSHPSFSMHEARTMVRYMLGSQSTTTRELPLSGTYVPEIPADDAGRGALLIRAVYTDKAAPGVPALTGEQAVVLRSNVISSLRAERTGVVASTGRGASGVQAFRNGVLVFRDLDLTGVTQIGIAARAGGGRAGQEGGQIEVRVGSPAGTLLGTVAVPARGAGAGPVAAAVAGVVVSGNIGGPQDGVAPAPAGGRGVIPPPAGAAAAAGRVAGPAGAGVAAGGGRGGGAAGVAVRLNVAVKPPSGRHDVYLVFKNDSASPTVSLMTVDDIRLSFGS